MEQYLQTVEKIATFILLGQTLLSFQPNQKYGKYLHFLFEIMILVILLLPIASLFKADVAGKFAWQKDRIEKSIEEKLEEADAYLLLWEDENGAKNQRFSGE